MTSTQHYIYVYGQAVDINFNGEWYRGSVIDEKPVGLKVMFDVDGTIAIIPYAEKNARMRPIQTAAISAEEVASVAEKVEYTGKGNRNGKRALHEVDLSDTPGGNFTSSSTTLATKKKKTDTESMAASSSLSSSSSSSTPSQELGVLQLGCGDVHRKSNQLGRIPKSRTDKLEQEIRFGEEAVLGDVKGCGGDYEKNGPKLPDNAGNTNIGKDGASAAMLEGIAVACKLLVDNDEKLVAAVGPVASSIEKNIPPAASTLRSTAVTTMTCTSPSLSALSKDDNLKDRESDVDEGDSDATDEAVRAPALDSILDNEESAAENYKERSAPRDLSADVGLAPRVMGASIESTEEAIIHTCRGFILVTTSIESGYGGCDINSDHVSENPMALGIAPGDSLGETSATVEVHASNLSDGNGTDGNVTSACNDGEGGVGDGDDSDISNEPHTDLPAVANHESSECHLSNTTSRTCNGVETLAVSVQSDVMLPALPPDSFNLPTLVRGPSVAASSLTESAEMSSLGPEASDLTEATTVSMLLPPSSSSPSSPSSPSSTSLCHETQREDEPGWWRQLIVSDGNKLCGVLTEISRFSF